MQIKEENNRFALYNDENQEIGAGVEKARKEHKKIIPLCPFAKKEFDTKPEYGDVLRK